MWIAAAVRPTTLGPQRGFPAGFSRLWKEHVGTMFSRTKSGMSRGSEVTAVDTCSKAGVNTVWGKSVGLSTAV